MSGSLLLGDDLAGVELNQHCAVGLDFLHGDGEAEVVEEEELQFQMVQFWEGKATNLCIWR